MRHKAAKGGKCKNGKSRKRKIWKAVCKIIIWHYGYRMHGLNNAAKDASLSVYFQPGVNIDHTVRSQTSMMMTTSVDSGDDQPSADVESQDLCEVCLIAQRYTRQVLVPCGHRRFCGSCRRPRQPDMPRPRANHHDSAPLLVF